MRLIGLMPVRNEEWCLGLTARAALMWCDEIEILLHHCVDDSTEIVNGLMRDLPGRVTWTIENSPIWEEMEHRHYLLQSARYNGATHIAIVDADELLTGNLLGFVRGLVEATPRDSILQLPGHNLRGSLERYHANGIWGNRWFSMAFPDDPRLHWAGDTFHQREPLGMPLREYKPVRQGEGGVLHLWGVSERRLRAKHALYKLTERVRWPAKPIMEIDRLYSLAIDAPKGAHQWEYGITPPEWLAPYAHLMQYLNVDAVPWQEEECRRIVRESRAGMLDNGEPSRFAGLDLFGVID